MICSYSVSLLNGSSLYLILCFFHFSPKNSPKPYEISNYYRKVHNLLLSRGIHCRNGYMYYAAMGFSIQLR